MPAEPLSNDSMVALLDLALLALLALGFVSVRRLRPPSVRDVPAAFEALERSIGRFVPGLPPGYTWEEAVEALKRSGVKIDWARIESSLADYEAFRYGGRSPPSAGKDYVVQLSMKIRRRVVGFRDKG